MLVHLVVCPKPLQPVLRLAATSGAQAAPACALTSQPALRWEVSTLGERPCWHPPPWADQTDTAHSWRSACRYRIEQELGTEIKPIPPIIEKTLYCA